jgi:hypothetical protein
MGRAFLCPLGRGCLVAAYATKIIAEIDIACLKEMAVPLVAMYFIIVYIR